MADPTDEELDAYIDDQLDIDRRFGVEMHLAAHPHLAARIMHDLGNRTGLRLLARDALGRSTREMFQAAALVPGRTGRCWRRFACIGGTVAVGALALAFVLIDRPPSYVDMAVASHRVAMMRAHMVSQIEAPALDALEIRTSTSIELPHLPANWHITDAQIFPTGDGPALLVALTTNDGRTLSIFALRNRSAAPTRPAAIREGQQSVAYWRRGEMSYALTGEADPRVIDAIAESLAQYSS